MATHASEGPAATAGASSTEETSRPVEMNTLTTSPPEHVSPSVHPVDQVDPAQSMAQPQEGTTGTTAQQSQPDTSMNSPSDPLQQGSTDPRPATTPMTRKQSEALGPAVEGAIASPTITGPTLQITLMLTTGSRHPYKIDEKYLKSRDAVARDAQGSFDPLSLSGYKLKELIWKDWRTEWEPRPTSPSSIRLITMGQMVDDKKALNDYKFNLSQPNVVHMTVKPADFGEDDEGAGAKGGKSSSIRQRDGGEGGAGCRCVIL